MCATLSYSMKSVHHSPWTGKIHWRLVYCICFLYHRCIGFFLVANWNQHKLLKNKNGKKFNARLNLSCIPVCVFQEILKFFAQMLLSIQHVHSKQILHRDLKTQNILLDKKREVVKIGDFGISKVLSSKSKAYTVRTYLYIFCFYWCFGKSFLLILELAYDRF